MEDLFTIISDKAHSVPGVGSTKMQVVTKMLKKSCDWPFPEKIPEA
jgi:hypothetical protein